MFYISINKQTSAPNVHSALIFHSCQQNYKTTDVRGHVIEGINGGGPHRRPVTSLEHK
jgi:hypothetical protein